MRTLIKNGKVCLPDKITTTNILIEAEKIKAIGKLNSTAADKIIDATNCYVAPGFIDFHVHLDDQIGNFYIADTYESGSKIAIQNGITSFVSFITQTQHETLLDAVETAAHKARNNTYCDYTWHLTPTTWDDISWHEILTLFDKGFNTIKLYTTYKQAGIYSNYETIKNILTKLKPYNIRTLIHCEDEKILVSQNPTQYDLSAAITHSQLRPDIAEITAIKKIIQITQETRALTHIVHVSTPESAALIYTAKQNIPITCETAPQYLFLNDTLLKQAGGYRYLCTPPLRNKAHQEKLHQLATKNYFDIYATDHCPFLITDKDKHCNNVLKIPKGLPGIGALAPMTAKLYDLTNDQEIYNMITHLTTTPAKLAGIYPQKGQITPNSDADLVVFAPNKNQTRPIHATLVDSYDPYPTYTTNLDFKQVLLRGEIIVANNKLINSIPQGTCLCQI